MKYPSSLISEKKAEKVEKVYRNVTGISRDNELFSESVSANAKEPIFKDELGFCTPFTLEMVANFVTTGAHTLLEPVHYFAPKKVRFDLYTRLNPQRKQELRTNDRKALRDSNFNPLWPVRISIHGWLGNSRTCSSAAIKDAYLDTGDFNVIIVDWGDYALDINYLRVIPQTNEIANQINAFARFLNKEVNTQFHKIYLIAHSMGCHVAGAAGKLLYPDRYGVIYALDTSGPIHRRLPPEQHLLPTDALYVEAIHTDIAFMGYNGGKIAHASFFPNWGLGQSHCPNVTTDRIPEFACDHFGSLYYFTESIRNSKAFGAIKCRNYNSIAQKRCTCGHKRCKAEVYMGGEPASPKRGIYYLSTRQKPPYGYGSECYMRKPIAPTAVRLNVYKN